MYAVPRFIKSLVFIISVLLNSNLMSCGGYNQDRGLTGQHSPDFPLNGFVNGELGVISPKYRISYLIIAYRYLSNHPLSHEEQHHVLRALGHFFNFNFGDYDFRVDANRANSNIWHEEDEAEFNEMDNEANYWWEQVNSTVADRANNMINYNFSAKIPFSRYQLASRRLNVIKREANIIYRSAEQKEAYLKAWFDAQDLLFGDHFDANKSRIAIEAIPKVTNPILKADRDYMLAVSYFNSTDEKDLLEAAQLLKVLGKNTQYPWHEWAAYLNYRALTRIACQEFSSEMPTEAQTTLLTEALAGMQELTKNSLDPKLQSAAADYSTIIKGRLNRKNTVIDLINQMNTYITNLNFANMIFYTSLSEWSYDSPIKAKDLRGSITKAEDSELLFWFIHYTSKASEENFTTAYWQWHKTPNNLAWLLVALNNIKYANAAQQKELFQAAEQVKATHPGFYSIRYALVKAIGVTDSLSKKSIAHRQALIDETLSHLKPNEHFSTQMSFYRAGIPLVANSEELLSYGFFIPSKAMIAIYDQTFPSNDPYYSPIEFSEALNQLPLSVLVKILNSKKLPSTPQKELYASVWARAMFLGQYAIADRIAKKTAQLNPALTTLINKSLKSKSADQRLKILVSALLYFPELSPVINFQNTWAPEIRYHLEVFYGIKARAIENQYSRSYWCAKGAINRKLYFGSPKSQFKPGPWLRLLNKAQQKELAAEQAQFNALPDGATWLADKTNYLAKKNLKDPENAELLALAINTTRVLGCYYSNNTVAKTFATLKRHYPNTDAATRTKYYF